MSSSSKPIMGIVIGSIITAITVGLPLSGALGNFFIPGILGILVVAGMAVPGALVGSIVGGRKEVKVGLATGLIGYLGATPIILGSAPLSLSPNETLLLVVPALIMFSIVGAIVGAVVGRLRKGTKPSKSTDKSD